MATVFLLDLLAAAATTPSRVSRLRVPRSSIRKMVSLLTRPDVGETDPKAGVRIKTVYDATGEVTDVTYKDITLSGITKYGIVIRQDYENGSPTGDPTTGVPITDCTFDEITGTVESDAVEIFILCGDDSCSDWTWEDIDITGGETSDGCENVPSGASCSE